MPIWSRIAACAVIPKLCSLSEMVACYRALMLGGISRSSWGRGSFEVMACGPPRKKRPAVLLVGSVIFIQKAGRALSLRGRLLARFGAVDWPPKQRVRV